MNKTAAIATIISATSTQPVIFMTSDAGRIARIIADRPNHFYLTGPMGLASSIGIGVALKTGETTVVVDDYASLLMNPVGMMSAGSLPRLPLVHIALDEGLHASADGQAVPSRGPALTALAEAAGYARVRTTVSLEKFADALRRMLEGCVSPVFIRCLLTEGDPAVPAWIDAGVELETRTRRFREHVNAPVRIDRAA